MVSTVTAQRTTTCVVAIEHPEAWTDEELQTAVQHRMADIINAADFWCGEQDSSLVQIARDGDLREVPEGMDPTSMREPVELDDSDLVPNEPVPIVAADAVTDPEVAGA